MVHIHIDSNQWTSHYLIESFITSANLQFIEVSYEFLRWLLNMNITKLTRLFFFNFQAVCSTMVTATLAVATLVCCQRHLAAAVCRSQHSFEKACWPARWRVKRSTTSTRATPKRTLRSSKLLRVWWKLPREVFIFPHIICQRIQQWTPDRNTASVIPLHPRVIVRPKRA